MAILQIGGTYMRKGLPDTSQNKNIDTFILSEYQGMLRIIRTCALLDERLAHLQDESFNVEADIIIDDFLSIEGIFWPSFIVKQGTCTLKILKDSYYRKDDTMRESRIATEMHHRLLLENEGTDEGEGLPEHIECSLLSQTTFSERTEPSLLSRKKTFLEKTYVNTNTITKARGAKKGDIGNSYVTRGFIRIDSASGCIMEESHE
jgi:hypothetical protein